MIKILTHDGVFHADEVFACALLKKVHGDATITRSRKMESKDFDFVVDINEVYSPFSGEFDHHQDGQLPAANMLVLNWVKAEKGPEPWSGLDKMFQFISNWDINVDDIHGKWRESTRGFGYTPSVSQMIQSMNAQDIYGPDQGRCFEKAVNWAETLIEASLEERRKQARWDLSWERREILDSGRLIYLPEFVPDWRRRVEREVQFCLSPGREEGQVNVTSVDSNKFQVQENAGTVFLHQNKFFGVFNGMEAAIEGCSLS